MILSRKWLNEFVECSNIDDKTFCEEMTLSGSKVETFGTLDSEIKNIVAGKVTEITRHPDSDHMWVCRVDVGSENLQIVTGAQNVKAGDMVPVALDNSLLPGGVEIKKGTLRGVESNGMLCSIKELGLTSHDYPDAADDGIWILTPDVEIGKNIAELIGADDHVIEFEITPNRPDCLSVIGLARETAATFSLPLNLHTPVIKGCGGNITDEASVTITDSELCPRYTAKMVKNVVIKPSPEWMRERLRNSGVRPINNIVDITNYVMLEYGQPMHAFDFSCVEGGSIIVRTAREGETIETLDGTMRKLTPNMLCICDKNKPVCVAGVMGGANSEIVGDTAVVLFESANFNGPSVRRTATALGMRTDASSRYEKGLDPENTVKAVMRACELVELLGAGEVVDGIIDVIPNAFEKKMVKFEPDRINALLGTDVSADEMVKILLKLGFELDGDIINVPSWRGDVEHYSDIAEEVARFYGYNKIPTTLMSGDTTCGLFSHEQKIENCVGETCRALGYDEIITYSFISPTYYDKIRLPEDSPLRDSLKILNPLGEDTSIMRTTVLPSMLEILTRNYNYRNKNVRLYEIGKTYFKESNGLADEKKVLSLGQYGNCDFYSIKGTVENIFSSLRINGVKFKADSSNPSYHPGRCADIYYGDEKVGVLGQIHPLAAANYGIDDELYCAEISLRFLCDNANFSPVYSPLPKYPSSTRDISLLCKDDITAGEITEVIMAAGGENLRSCNYVDVYKGIGIMPGYKSITFTLTMRADDRTMTIEMADKIVEDVLTSLEKELGAVLRGK